MNRVRAMVGLLALVVLSGILLVAPSAQAQQGAIVVEGRIVNGTPGSSDVSGLTVTFHEEGVERHDHIEVTTDESGQFRFEGIQYNPAMIYGVSVRYQDALYGADVDLSSGSPLPVELKIYEATDNSEVLHATTASLLFADADKSTETIAALEIIQIANDSDRTFVPGTQNPMNLIRFGLLPDAQGLHVDTRLLGADIVQVDRGFAVLASVPPGTHEIMYTYQFPYSGAEATFEKSLPFGAELLRVLSPYEVLSLSSGDIGGPEEITIGERPYQLIQAEDLPRGARISINLSDLPQMSLADRVGNAFTSIRYEYAAPVTLGLLMAALVAFAIWRRRAAQYSEALAATPEASLETHERQALTRLISELERSFRTGSLDEKDYQRRRRVLEARLSALPKG